MPSFAFRTAAQILFGAGESARAPEIAARFGRRVLFVTGGSSLERSGAFERFLHGLTNAGTEVVRWKVDQEPDTRLADEGGALCRTGRCEVVLAIGGGSVIDAAKAVAALSTHGGKAIDYVEEVGGGRPIERVPLPLVAVPTTAGSGSEVTRNSVLRVPELSVKR